MKLAVAAHAALLCVGCVPVEPASSVLRQAAIYGADGRRDLYDAPDAGWEELARRSVAAVVFGQNIDRRLAFCGDAGDATVLAPTASTVLQLCASERFGDQPSVANCSATLIDDDLMLTALHCVPQCAGLTFIFGLHYSTAQTLDAISRSQVFSCARVAAAVPIDDLAVVQLDRPVAAPFAPAGLASVAPEVSDPIGVIGFPMGVPMKISADCLIKEVVGNTYRHNCDSNAGNSGSGTFDSRHHLFAVMSTGPGDFKPTVDGCRVSVQYDDDGRLTGLPTVPQLPASLDARSAVVALCDARWPSQRLCGRGPQCADGVCSAGDDGTCSDCAAPRCGDGQCDADEDCFVDCRLQGGPGCQDDGGTKDAGVPDAGEAHDGGEDAGEQAAALPAFDARLPIASRSCSVSGDDLSRWAAAALWAGLRRARRRPARSRSADDDAAR